MVDQKNMADGGALRSMILKAYKKGNFVDLYTSKKDPIGIIWWGMFQKCQTYFMISGEQKVFGRKFMINRSKAKQRVSAITLKIGQRHSKYQRQVTLERKGANN